MKRKWVAVLLAVNLVLSGSTMVFAAETSESLPEVPAANVSYEGTEDELTGIGTGTDSTDVASGADNSGAVEAAKTVSEVNGTGDETRTDKTDTGNGGEADERAELAALAEEDGNAETADATTSTGTTSSGITWELTDGVLTVSGSGVIDTELTESIDAQMKMSNVISVKIEEGITGIGYAAFWSYENLTEVSIPNSVTEIGNYAFDSCKKLKSITIPSGVTEIGDGAFRYCNNLTEVMLPESVVKIKYMAFCGCSSLNRITIPKSVKEIEEYAFSGCKSLAGISIPEGVTRIGRKVFEGCENLTDITIPKGVAAIEYKAFEGCKSLLAVTIPSDVRTIGHGAFMDCTGLDSIVFEGDAPEIGGDKGVEEPFQNVTAIASHPRGNSTWTTEIKEAMGSKLSWTSSSPVNDSSISTSPKTETLRIVPGVTDYTYVIGSGGGATIECTGELKDFVCAYMDGVKVDRDNYTLKEGSTILTFTSKYLDTLSVGNHRVTLEYTYASIDTELNILDRSNASGLAGNSAANGVAGNRTNTSGTMGAPETGDSASILPWAVISVLAAGICMTTVLRRRCFR